MSKAAFIDVDGTLTNDNSSWERIHVHFGLTDRAKENSKLFFTNQIDYNEWARLDVQLWKGRAYKEIHNALLPPILRRGVISAFKGYDIVLISGGIDVLVNEVAKMTGADQAYSNSIGQTNGKIDGTFSINVEDKSEVIKKISSDNNYKLQDCLAIGDNANDISMFEVVGNSIAINPKSEPTKEAAKFHINTENFEDILTLLFNREKP